MCGFVYLSLCVCGGRHERIARNEGRTQPLLGEGDRNGGADGGRNTGNPRENGRKQRATITGAPRTACASRLRQWWAKTAALVVLGAGSGGGKGAVEVVARGIRRSGDRGTFSTAARRCQRARARRVRRRTRESQLMMDDGWAGGVGGSSLGFSRP